jgi:hypothetical protein
MKYSAKRSSAVRTCVFSVHFCDVVLVLFCDRIDLLK